MQSDELLRAKLTALRNDKIPPEELYGLIHDFGHAMFLEAEPDVVTLLNHPNAQIRCIAIRVLTFHWDVRRHRDELIRLLQHDPEYEVRSFAARGLGFVFRESKDAVVSRALINIIRDNDEDPYLREAAYKGLRGVWTPVDVKLADIQAEIQWQKERDKDLDVSRSREEFRDKLWMWRQERLLKIDWEFVERIERTIQGESSGSEHSSTR